MTDCQFDGCTWRYLESLLLLFLFLSLNAVSVAAFAERQPACHDGDPRTETPKVKGAYSHPPWVQVTCDLAYDPFPKSPPLVHLGCGRHSIHVLTEKVADNNSQPRFRDSVCSIQVTRVHLEITGNVWCLNSLEWRMQGWLPGRYACGWHWGPLCKVCLKENLLFFLLIDTPRSIQHVT